MWFLIRYISTKSKLTLILGGISFFLSLISKETGIAFLIIIPLTLFFFSNVSKKSNIYISIFLLGITGLWLVLRMIIFKDLPENIVTQTSALNNTLYAATDFSSKYGTAFFILLRYIGLLIFPHPLSCDYNFAQIKIISFNDVEALIGLLVYIGLGVYSIINFKKKSIVVFGILLYLISLAPVSNIFFLGGSSMAERFMYIPSLGFCIILGFYLAKLTNTDHIKWNNHTIYKFFANNSSLFIGMFAILFLYSYKIFDRNVDWKDTLTIFSRDIKVSSKSATANWILGNELLFRGSKSIIKSNQIDTFNLAKKYLNHALEIAPGLFYASSNLGFIYLVENKPDSAYLYLKGGLKTGSNNAQLNYYFGSALLLQKKYDEAIEVLNRTINLNSKYEDAYLMLAAAYLSKGDPKNGLTTYLQLIEINPNNGKVYYLAAGIYNSLGDINKAKEFMEKSISLGYQPN